MEKKKKFILRAKTWHVGYYTGTIEEMCSLLNSFGIEVTEIVDIMPEVDLGVTYNRAICTKMKVLGYDKKSEEAFLDEYKQLVNKYATDRKRNGPEFAYNELNWFFKERPIETDAINVLIADDTTFCSSQFDKEENRIVSYISPRSFKSCSEFSEDHLWHFLTEIFYYQRP